VTGFARPASAQDVAKVELSAGWNYMAVKSNDDEDWTHFSKGWYGDVAYAVNNMWSVVGVVAGDYKTITDQGGPVDVSLHPYAFGVRAGTRANPKATPYAQVLFGATRLKVSQGSDSVSENIFTYLVGGGININASGKLGARVGADYFRIMPGDGSQIAQEALHGLRLTVGLVFGFGG
jgi:opacity protein-like surface antigen